MKKRNIWVGKKVYLRAVEMKDIGTFFIHGRDYDTEADRLCGSIPFPRSRELLKAKVEALTKAEPKDDDFIWIIENSKGQTVGGINTFECNKRNGTFKYGLSVNRAHWGKGYAREAIVILLGYFFHELRYQKCTVQIYAFNNRSLNLHKRFGFRDEGCLRRMVFTGGQYYDEIVMGLTAEEFSENHPRWQPGGNKGSYGKHRKQG